MENINNHDDHQPQTSRLIKLMTSMDTMAEFLKIISSSDALQKLAEMITSDLDLFVRILNTGVGSCSVFAILGISEEINSILFYAIIKRFTEIMTHKDSYMLGLKILYVCNVHQIKLFYSVMHCNGNALVLSRSQYGCIILKRAMTMAEDRFKDDFLNLITDHAFWLTRDDLGKSLIKHVLQLDFTQKTTQNDTRLHELMAEFDEILKNSDIAELQKLALKLTSDSDLFIDFVKTRRGSLLVQIILGKSEEIDSLFLEAIKHRLIDVITIRSSFGYRIVLRLTHVFMERGNIEVERQILDEIAWKALYLTKKYPMGGVMVRIAIDVHNELRTAIIASRLQGHYVELSFHEHGSDVVEKLVGKGKSLLALSLIVKEIVECDEDKLLRLAKDEYGNKVLRKTLEFAKKKRRADLFGELVEKLKPFFGLLRGSQGENTIIDSESESETIKDRIVSERNH